MTSVEASPPSTPQGTAGGGTLNELTELVKAAGLLDRSRAYFRIKIASTFLALAAGWTAFAWAGHTWWQLAVAVYLAFWFGQTGLVMHDIGHRQVWRTRGRTQAMGYFHANLLVGISFGWWVGHHTRHHNHPNHLTLDPDVVRRRVIFHPGQSKSRSGKFARFVIRHQSWLLYVLPLMDWFRVHLSGFAAAVEGNLKQRRGLDLTLLTVHLAAYGTAVFYVLPPVKAIAFIFVHQALFSLYLGLIFAPNHKGLAVRDGEQEPDWLPRQVLTSRNIRPGRLTDFLYGGLNYQIEHHLFPGMPRPHLRRAQPLVKHYCLTHGLSYHEVSLATAYGEISRHLATVTSEVRSAESGGGER
ncbi:acyl-CoA desaturase [Streptomyces sp. MNP-20]|uniref:fatty acid desaturase family protein n=1 Tax=Streptomyces sp. MNP-20 TaxID=2721165 RepID=UPI0015567BC6|nr:acyl-CoA desaturase [Streptomyces sp. MNP-20]